MKNLINFSFLLFTFSLIVNFADAQNNESVLVNLQGKTWKMMGNTDKDYAEEYRADNFTSILNGEVLATFEYYLSDSIDSKFDPSKVGNVENGKYIIERLVRDKNDSNPTPLSVLKIVSINKSNLVLKNVENNNTLIFKAQ